MDPCPYGCIPIFFLCPIHGRLRENDVLNFSMAGSGWGGNFRSTTDTLPKLSRIKSPVAP